MQANRVLIPVDGSTFARHIFPVVVKFLDPRNTHIVLFRVADPPEGHVGLPGRLATSETLVSMWDSPADLEATAHPIYASQERDSVEGELRRQMLDDEHYLQTRGYPVTTVVRFGAAGEEIVAYAETQNIDLVAMTTHWRTGLDRLLMGSVAQYVAHHLRIPVLTLHDQSPDSL
jgi:nucleotide-binding universal stress UspA family protein